MHSPIGFQVEFSGRVSRCICMNAVQTMNLPIFSDNQLSSTLLTDEICRISLHNKCSPCDSQPEILICETFVVDEYYSKQMLNKHCVDISPPNGTLHRADRVFTENRQTLYADVYMWMRRRYRKCIHWTRSQVEAFTQARLYEHIGKQLICSQ